MINAYDIETYIDNKSRFHIPYCVCFVLKNKKYSFFFEKNEDIIIKSILKIFSLLSKKELVVIYAHNLDFDGALILSSLSKQNAIHFTTFIRENNIYSIKLFFDTKNVEFKCSYKILPSSLKKIALSFNLPPKLPFPYLFASCENLDYIGPLVDYKYFSSYDEWKKISSYKNFNFRKYSIIYCLRDVMITSEFIKIIAKLLRIFNINIQNVYSAPSLSFKIFITKFNKNNIKLKYNYHLDELIRPAYFGGRCEVYGNPIQSEYIFHFDFSGMYAQCMMEKFCFGDYKIVKDNYNLNHPGYYHIEYESNDLYIPILPHHRIRNNKLMFTNGENIGIFWFEEILLALKYGVKIKKINYGIIFNNFDYIFNEFVTFFTELRKKGDEYKNFGKLMINSLYGRLGMNEYPYLDIFIPRDQYDFYASKYNIISRKPLNDFDFIKIELNRTAVKEFMCDKKRKIYSNISVAAAITSKARIKLYNAQQDVISNGGRILYSDTDSIFAVFKENVLNRRHGEIYWDSKKDDTVVQDAIFIAPKTYGIVTKNNTSVKIKGVIQNKIEFEFLKKKFFSDEKTILIHDLHSIDRSFFNLKDNILDKEIEINAYDKRRFINNKTDSIAYKYENFEYK